MELKTENTFFKVILYFVCGTLTYNLFLMLPSTTFAKKIKRFFTSKMTMNNTFVSYVLKRALKHFIDNIWVSKENLSS